MARLLSLGLAAVMATAMVMQTSPTAEAASGKARKAPKSHSAADGTSNTMLVGEKLLPSTGAGQVLPGGRGRGSLQKQAPRLRQR